MFGIGTQELLVILLIILVLFGAKKIPEMMRGLGRGIQEFKQASSEVVNEVQSLGEESPDKSDSSDTPVG